MTKPYEDYIEANRKNWDDRVPIHVSSPHSYDIEGFIDDPEKLTLTARSDSQFLPDLAGRSMLHLMCHIGLDTMSWARLGARVIGVDLSGESIRVATEVAERASSNAKFVQSDVYDAGDVIEGKFDIVYMSMGVLIWLPDLERLAGVVSSFLKPGGLFHLTEIHPVATSLDVPSDDQQLRITKPYFESGEPLVVESDVSYVRGEGKIEHTTTYQWLHSMGEIVTAFTGSGLRLTMLKEHPFGGFPQGPPLERKPDGWWEYPHGPEMVPLMYTLQAVKDGR